MSKSADYFLRLFKPAPWMTDASCRGMGPDLFHPERGQRVLEARAVCAECPVVVQCGQHALDEQELIGIWGGMTGRERRDELNANPRAPRPKFVKCGTVAGHDRHVANGEPVCSQCRWAQLSAERHRQPSAFNWDEPRNRAKRVAS